MYFWRCWVFAAAQPPSSRSKQGPLLAAVCGPLIAVASPVSEHGLQVSGLQ